MSNKIILLLMFVVFLFSSMTMFLVLTYVNPYFTNLLVIISLFFSFLLAVSTFLAIVLYIIKKIHYRGQVLGSHISSSFRQGLLCVFFLFGLAIFMRIGAPLFFTGLLLGLLLLFFELFIQNIMN